MAEEATELPVADIPAEQAEEVKVEQPNGESEQILTITVEFYEGKGKCSYIERQVKASGTVTDLKAVIWTNYMENREKYSYNRYNLRYQGTATELQDDHTLSECGLKDGDTVPHIE